MKQVEDEELSALLDGELNPERAEAVRAALGADPALGKEFDALSQLDARLRDLVEAEAFMPDVTFPIPVTNEAFVRYWPAGIAVVAALIVARFVPKLAELPLFGIAFQLAVCAAISFIVIRLSREAQALPARTVETDAF